MWTALLSKELRECGLFAGLALLAQMQLLGSGMDMSLIPLLSSGRGTEIPFLSKRAFDMMSDRELMFITIAIISAIVIGLNQTLMESWRQTSLFLLHRPMPRSQIFLVKLAAGGLILLDDCVDPFMIYCLWAATPGTHASPFFWSMTEPWWHSVLVAFACYLGAFLTGIRPANWIGSRTWPLIAATGMALGLKLAPVWTAVVYAGLVALIACLVISILNTTRHREYP